MNTLFIQFYSEFKSTRKGTCFALCNGFSDTYDLCKNKGDFLWIDDSNLENSDYELPISKGTVYISSFYVAHLVQSHKWAKKYTDIKFVVGGPAVLSGVDYRTSRPSNLEFTTKSVEEYFNVPNFSSKWKLELSDIKEDLNKYDVLTFSYTLETLCYWSKCTFCNYHFRSRIRKNVDLSYVNSINFDGVKQVRVNTPAITPAFMKKFFQNITYEKNVIYDFMMRCDEPVYTALETNLNGFDGIIPNMKVRFGIEFPSDKMLKFMKKGITVNNALKALSIANKFENVNFYTMYMVGWPNLDRDDINSLKYYVSKVPKTDSIIIFKTFYKFNTDLYDVYKDRIRRNVYEGDFYRGYFVDLIDDELKINMEARDLMKTMPANWTFVVPPGLP